MSGRSSLTFVILLSVANAASCSSEDGAQVCDLLPQSELGASASHTEGEPLPNQNGGSCVYLS